MKHPSFDDFVSFASHIRKIEVAISALNIEASAKLGKTKTRRFWTLQKKIMRIKSDFDDELFKAYPTRATTHVFYGGGANAK